MLNFLLMVEALAKDKNELTFGFSEGMSKATPDVLSETIKKMNP